MAIVKMTPEAVQQFSRLPNTIKDRLHKLTHRLLAWPQVSGVKTLTGNLAGWYRLRTGDYRIRFFVRGETIIIDKIGHRRDFYEDR